jgi:hypothetical protein
MGYALLWIEALTACVLLVALIAACAARLSRRWLRLALASLPALVLGGTGVLMASMGGVLASKAAMHAWILWYAASWTLAFAVVTVLVLRRALRASRGTPAEEPVPRPAGAAWPRAKLLVAVAAGFILVTTTLWNMRLAAQNKLAAVRAEAGALALSLTPSRPSDAENAALVYEQAFALMADDEKVLEISEEAGYDAARTFLAKHEAALTLLRRASGMPACRFEYASVIPDVQAVMPVLADLRRAARLLALDARVQAAAGHPEPALGDVAALFALARHASENPMLIQAIVAIAIRQVGHGLLQDVLAACEPSESDLRPLLAEDGFSFWRLFRRSVRMERAFGLASLVDTGEMTGGEFFLLNEIAGYRGMMLEYDEAAGLPYSQARAKIERISSMSRDGRWGILQAELSPAIERAAAEAAEAEADVLLDRMALAAAAYRSRHGRLPAEPAALVPEFLSSVPIDPFSGEPMKMRAADGAIVFYSIGADMKDDGGAVEWDKKRRSGDLIFRLPVRAGSGPHP